MPVAWSVIGALFVAAPLDRARGHRGDRAYELRSRPGRAGSGCRVVRHWRVLDLDQVRTVRLDDGGLGGFGFGFAGGFGFGGGGGFGAGRFTGRSVVLEDAFGGRVDIGLDALDAGISEVLRHGLAPEVHIDPDVGPGARPGDPKTSPPIDEPSPGMAKV